MRQALGTPHHIMTCIGWNAEKFVFFTNCNHPYIFLQISLIFWLAFLLDIDVPSLAFLVELPWASPTPIEFTPMST